MLLSKVLGLAVFNHFPPSELPQIPPTIGLPDRVFIDYVDYSLEKTCLWGHNRFYKEVIFHYGPPLHILQVGLFFIKSLKKHLIFGKL